MEGLNLILSLLQEATTLQERATVSREREALLNTATLEAEIDGLLLQIEQMLPQGASVLWSTEKQAYALFPCDEHGA